MGSRVACLGTRVAIGTERNSRKAITKLSPLEGVPDSSSLHSHHSRLALKNPAGSSFVARLQWRVLAAPLSCAHPNSLALYLYIYALMLQPVGLLCMGAIKPVHTARCSYDLVHPSGRQFCKPSHIGRMPVGFRTLRSSCHLGQRTLLIANLNPTVWFNGRVCTGRHQGLDKGQSSLCSHVDGPKGESERMQKRL